VPKRKVGEHRTFHAWPIFRPSSFLLRCGATSIDGTGFVTEITELLNIRTCRACGCTTHFVNSTAVSVTATCLVP
jgi:hypothetical protein